MRQQTINIYKFDELSEEVQENVIDDFNYDDLYPWYNDNVDTRTAFESIFPIKIDDWDCDIHRRSFITFHIDNDIKKEILEFTGIRLMKYILNMYSDYLFKGKYYSTQGSYLNGEFTYKYKHSKIIKDTCCVLTGYYMDDSILNPIYNFLKHPSNDITLYDLMEDCLNSWIAAFESDIKDFYSKESLKDFAEANGYEFYENGKMV